MGNSDTQNQILLDTTLSIINDAQDDMVASVRNRLDPSFYSCDEDARTAQKALMNTLADFYPTRTNICARISEVACAVKVVGFYSDVTYTRKYVTMVMVFLYDGNDWKLRGWGVAA